MSGRLLVNWAGRSVPEQDTWRGLIEHWRAVLNQYMDWERGCDLAEWYSERSHTGFLAAAVWKMGGVALEEYSSLRESKVGDSITETSPGRCDLYFSVENLDCTVEAKHEWVSSYSREDEERIRNQMLSAKRQLETIPKDERGTSNVAICWAIPWLKSSGVQEEKFLTEFSNRFRSNRSLIGTYYVPRKIRIGIERKYEGADRTYPGIIFIGEIAAPK